jgi:hypothetical protein
MKLADREHIDPLVAEVNEWIKTPNGRMFSDVSSAVRLGIIEFLLNKENGLTSYPHLAEPK